MAKIKHVNYNNVKVTIHDEIAVNEARKTGVNITTYLKQRGYDLSNLCIDYITVNKHGIFIKESRKRSFSMCILA